MKTLLDHITNEPLLAGIARTELVVKQNEWLEQATTQLVEYLFDPNDLVAFWNCYEEHEQAIATILQADKDCYLAYVYHLGYPRLDAVYKELKISDDIRKATLADFDLRAVNYYAMYNHGGIDDYRWLTRHIRGTLFQLGRLQYVFNKQFDYSTHIYRHLETGEIVKLAADQLAVGQDGFITTTEKAAFTSTLEKREQSVIGYVVDEIGNILPEKVELVLAAYETIVEPGDYVLDIHIPATGKMDINDCMQSLKDAWQFGQTYYPQIAYKGIVCSSWLLSDELKEMLPEQSNIVQFSNWFTRCAGRHSDHELIYKWIFGMDKEKSEYKTHIPATSLQRGTHQLMDEGRWFETRAGFIMPDVFL